MCFIKCSCTTHLIKTHQETEAQNRTNNVMSALWQFRLRQSWLRSNRYLELTAVLMHSLCMTYLPQDSTSQPKCNRMTRRAWLSETPMQTLTKMAEALCANTTEDRNANADEH